MQSVEKKQHRSSHGSRLPLLLLAVAAVALVMVLHSLLNRSTDAPIPEVVSTAEVLIDYPHANVSRLTITRRGEDSWTVERDAEGYLTLLGEGGFRLTDDAAYQLEDAICSIVCDAVLSEDPEEYTAELEAFGLADPVLIADVTFRDGTQYVLRIGELAAHDATWRYMIIDGDPRLFSLSKGMADDLSVSRESIHQVIQPVLHKARIDRITLRDGDGEPLQEWQLNGSITDSDAIDRWQLTVPFPYPADADAMTKLLANAVNLRLGAYVAPATAETLAAYGFTQPRMTIEIHMASGTIGTTNADGAFETQDWPESTCTFVIGGARSDMVDYVLHDGSIYVSSHFTMGVFMDVDPIATISRYPVLTALGNLASLHIEENGVVTEYVLTRTEQVAPNNDLVTDDNGNVVYDVTCTRNGLPCDYAAFEAAYAMLAMVTVSGQLPQNAVITEPPHTVYTFTDVNGTVHTVALRTFDALHDAVAVDGHHAFYLIKGGFRLNLE